MSIHRTEAYHTTDGTIEIKIRMIDGLQDMTVRTNLTLSDASELARQITEAVRTYPSAEAEVEALHP